MHFYLEQSYLKHIYLYSNSTNWMKSIGCNGGAKKASLDPFDKAWIRES